MSFDFAKHLNLSFGSPTRLIELARAQEQAVQEVPPRLNLQINVVRKYRKWLKNPEVALTRRECKILFWSLECKVDSQIALIFNEQELRPALLWVLQYKMLRGLMIAYFNSYSRLPEVWRNELGEVLSSKMRQCPSNRSAAKYWREEGIHLFAVDGIHWAVKKVISQNQERQAWESLRISLQSDFIQAAIIERIRVLSQKESVNILPRVIEFLKVDYVNLETVKKSIDVLLTPFMLKKWTEGVEQRVFFSYCVQLLGDPRLSKSVRWDEVSPTKKKLIIEWLSIQDITLFFNTITMHPDRREFWMKYVDRITYSRIALSQSILNNPPLGMEDFIAQRRYAVLSQAECAFIMQIGEFVIVEFSRHGNACYIYKRNQLPFELDAAHFSTIKLKDKNIAYERLKHIGGWQYTFDHIIRRM